MYTIPLREISVRPRCTRLLCYSGLSIDASAIIPYVHAMNTSLPRSAFNVYGRLSMPKAPSVLSRFNAQIGSIGTPFANLLLVDLVVRWPMLHLWWWFTIWWAQIFAQWNLLKIITAHSREQRKYRKERREKKREKKKNKNEDQEVRYRNRKWLSKLYRRTGECLTCVCALAHSRWSMPDCTYTYLWRENFPTKNVSARSAVEMRARESEKLMDDTGRTSSLWIFRIYV